MFISQIMKLVTSQKSLKNNWVDEKRHRWGIFFMSYYCFYRSTPIFSVCTFQVMLSIYIDLQLEFLHLPWQLCNSFRISCLLVKLITLLSYRNNSPHQGLDSVASFLVFMSGHILILQAVSMIVPRTLVVRQTAPDVSIPFYLSIVLTVSTSLLAVVVFLVKMNHSQSVYLYISHIFENHGVYNYLSPWKYHGISNTII